MLIGLVAPPWMPVPPTSYGGTEAVVDNIAQALTQLGHDVRLFTVRASSSPVHRQALFDEPPELINSSVHEAAHVLAAYQALGDVDVIHDHTILGPLIGAPGRECPAVVVTHHGPFDAENRRLFEAASRHARVVAISQSQASYAAEVPIAAVVHHGIDVDLYSPGESSADGAGEYLLWVGRMNEDKGADRAIEIARRAGRPLVMLAKMREPAECGYFEEHVQPRMGEDVTLHLEPSMDFRLDVQRGAAALLNPIRWPEPFGLVMAEALATATPVISTACGAAPEIVDHGRTGFVCPDDDALVDAVSRLDEIDRSACRAAAETRFSRRRMASDYVAVYESATGADA